jgi:hypothetical protein
VTPTDPPDDNNDPPDDPEAPFPPVRSGPMDVPLAGSRPAKTPEPTATPPGPPSVFTRSDSASESESFVVSRMYGTSESGPATGVPRALGATGATTKSSRKVSAADLTEDDELRDAIGATPLTESKKHKQKRPPTLDDAGDPDDPDDPDADKTPKKLAGRRRTALVIAVTTFVGLAVGALVLLGYINGSQYAISCEPEQIIAQKGRAFPPWGMRTLGGELWKPIKIPADAECRARETENENELAGWYLDQLVDRASTLLTAREVTKADDAAAMLEQALLHARAPERRDQRKEIERLLGDVGYWRASAKLRDAASALTDAAKQFDTAASQRPRHVSDASAWATHARKIADQLRAGPADAKAAAGSPTSSSAAGPPDRPAAPTGVALPVEPEQPGTGSNAGTGSGNSTTPTAAPPDAGVPTGGVLL